MVSDSNLRYRTGAGSVSMLLIVGLFGFLSTANAKFASIVIDADSGRVLHEVEADTLNYPASLTKMMTLYMVFTALENKKISLNTRWKVSRFAASQPPTKLGLKAGRTISVRDSILALVTKSANDIAVVVAENMAGSESRFARLMTRKARDLDMDHTTFRNASGLPDRRQKTTARDISILALALLRDFPEYYGFFSTEVFQYGNRLYRNHNHLLHSYHGTDGIKTGYIRASGYNLAASTVRNGRRLVGVVMGGRTANARNRQMIYLLDRAFAKLEQEKPRRVVNVYRSSPSVSFKPKYALPERTSATRHFAARKDSDWGIQVGAFSYFKPAKKAASRAKGSAPELLRASRLVVSPFRSGSGYIYRARLFGIGEHQARRACEVLRSKQISCITVPPSDKQAELVAR